MILDSSAIVALVVREPGWDSIAEVLEAAPQTGVGAPTLVETLMVLSNRMGPGAHAVVERLLQRSGTHVVGFTDAHRLVAVQAYERFGRGRHPARLNLGDCFSYATAVVADAPLLCVGDDFPLTDIPLVLPRA